MYETQVKEHQKIDQVLDSISRDRSRSNLLKKYEQLSIAYLVQRIPAWINSNMLTGIGLFGSIVVFSSFVLGAYFSRYFLLLGVPGFMISWFGDSLDGRLAYYRNIPRKLYGFSLDITVDWLSIIFIGCGFIVYNDGVWDLLGYGFVVMYGWEMIITLMRYKITGKYSIDSGKFGPTEARIIISLFMIAEVFIQGSIIYSAAVACIVLFIINILDTRMLLSLADEIDISERKKTGNLEF
jgi:hypothetical protein